jgi:hypothetical protein
MSVPEDSHLEIQLTARKRTKMSQQTYDTMVRNYTKWVAEGKNPQDAAELAVHQARLVTWTEQIGEPRRQQQREKKQQEKAARYKE